MKRRVALVGSLVLMALLPCAGLPGQPPGHLSKRQFQQLILELSESPGVFDTDNLVSNESSYLHVVSHLRQMVKPGGAYVGVGPDQNFTYITHARSSVAFIVDVRRDNLLLHLYLKQLFQDAPNRWRYLSFLFGKPLPSEMPLPSSADVVELVSTFKHLPADRHYFEANFERFWRSIREQFPKLSREEDRPILYRMAASFFEEGLALKYRSHGRLPRPYYPSYEQLMLERDLEGRPGHYLNLKRDFQFLKEMQEENRILPVMGDFGGKKALRAIARYLREQETPVSVFYTSNVEFYLFRSRTFSQFMDNIGSFPLHPDSLLLRSYFSYWREHPETIPGYFVTSLAQRVKRFLELHREKPYLDYWDMVTRDYISAVMLSLEASIP